MIATQYRSESQKMPKQLLIISIACAVSVLVYSAPTEPDNSNDENRITYAITEEQMNELLKIATVTYDGIENCLRVVHEYYNTLGENINNPASSCREIADKYPNRTMGSYLVKSHHLAPLVLVHCNLQTAFLSNDKGWTRVAYLNMTDAMQQCPYSFKEVIVNGKRLCGREDNPPGCSSVIFRTHGIAYEQVCGRVIKHRVRTPDAFYRYPFACPNQCTLNDPYLDGVSITHGHESCRQHIWSIASGIPVRCNIPPDFIGENYICSSHSVAVQDETFCTQLPELTSDDIEVRLCTDQGLNDEDVPIEFVELYIR